MFIGPEISQSYFRLINYIDNNFGSLFMIQKLVEILDNRSSFISAQCIVQSKRKRRIRKTIIKRKLQTAPCKLQTFYGVF